MQQIILQVLIFVSYSISQWHQCSPSADHKVEDCKQPVCQRVPRSHKGKGQWLDNPWTGYSAATKWSNLRETIWETNMSAFRKVRAPPTIPTLDQRFWCLRLIQQTFSPCSAIHNNNNDKDWTKINTAKRKRRTRRRESNVSFHLQILFFPFFIRCILCLHSTASIKRGEWSWHVTNIWNLHYYSLCLFDLLILQVLRWGKFKQLLLVKSSCHSLYFK